MLIFSKNDNTLCIRDRIDVYKRQVLQYLQESDLGIPYGVNCLNVDAMGFELANQYGCSFIQMDSVIGHVKPRDEASMEAFLKTFRGRSRAFLMGGVRFKYQPILSEHTLEEDLITAKGRCDAICVTEDETGQETSMDKIIRFRKAIGKFPLFVCAGVTPENVSRQLQYADGVVVGSYFKDNYKDYGEVCKEHIQELVSVVKKVRAELK